MATIAIDTSVAVPYLLRAHEHHDAVRQYVRRHDPRLTSHSLAETYSVLTRLPGDARLTASDAMRLIEANFPQVITLPAQVARRLHVVLAESGIAGGAVYDAVVALAARHHRLPLVTRDARAASTYGALAVPVEVLRV